jgi:oligoendopeptidase F
MTVITDPKIEYQLSGWDLSELLSEPGETSVSARLAEIEKDIQELEARRSGLHPQMDPGSFLDTLRLYERLTERMNALSGYASLWFHSDTGSQEALTFRNRIRQANTGFENRILFFTLWWRSLSDEEAAPLMPDRAQHPDYHHYLEDIRRLKPHTLDERSEQIINAKDSNGISGIMTIYSMLTNRLEFNLEIDGEVQKLTRDALMGNVYSPNADLRAAAYQEMYRVYEHEAKILGQIYVHRVRDWYDENVTFRGYNSPIAVRNVDNDIPDRAVDVLLEVARRNAPIFQRYFRLKANWLGMDRLRRYDVYAPLATSDREIPFSDAARTVIDTFEEFHPLFSAHAERIFNENHIDSEVRKGKRAGAFCSTILPKVTPWVLVNYTGRVRDVATLAHELGHAVHSMLAENHSILVQHASLPLCETASVMSEMLVTDRLLREEPDPLARRELLATAIDDVYATVLRQTYFVLFERAAHQAILEGRSVDDLSEIYFGMLQEQFGDSVDIAPEFRYEWLSIPHIYQTPFYCYAYSFGQLLVLALYRRFLDQGESFKPGYIRMLAYGGAARPEHVLSEVGIDMTDPSFWQGGFDVLSQRIKELEGMEQ